MRLSFIPRPMDDLDHQLNIELAAAERARASLIAAAKAAAENRSMSALVQRMLEAETLDHAGAALPDVCIIHRRGRGFGEAARYSQAAVSAQRMGKLLQGKIHRVDPKFASWPSSLTKNPYKSLRVDPNRGPTL